MFEIGAGKLVAKYSLLLWWVFFGANVNAVIALKKAREENTAFTFIDYLIAMILSMFAGSMFGALALSFGIPERHLFSAVGLGAFLGVAGLNKVANVVLETVFSKYIKDGSNNRTP